METARTHDELGRLTDIDTTLNTTAIQDNTHAWRSDGSLEKRAARVAGRRGLREEKFSYDYLNRLTGAKTHIGGSSTASRTLAFAYDLAGNLTTKTSDVSADSDTTAYAYASGTNRLSSATLGGVKAVKHTFAHDTSGHITRYNACSDNASTCANADDTFIDWNARGLAEKVTVGKSATDAKPTARDSLHYGPDGARYLKKSEWAVKSGNTTTMKTSRKYYAGAYEKTVTVGGDTVERIRVSDSVVHVRTTPASGTATAAFEYAHRDHLGSLEAVTDASGKTLTVLGHDPYGERRNDWASQLTPAQIGTLLDGHGERVSRGFTGHEHLDRTGLIHMNGRIYDPRLGRFLSPDPIVGDPTSSRSWNLYSYVGNNPLSYVDPTGLVQAGPMCPIYGPAMCMAGSGAGTGGSTTRTATATFTVYGVAAVPYLRAEPEIAISATGVGYGARVVAKAGIKGAAKAAHVADSAGAATQPNRIYSARELLRRADEPGPYHNFPESFNREIFEKGTRTTTQNAYTQGRQGLSDDLVQYRLPGTVSGRDGVFEMFTRPSTSGNAEVIVHRFFRPNP